MNCRNCNKKNFKKLTKIGYQPISSLFLKSRKKIKNFPLDLFECKSCRLVQLSKIPNLSDMYGPEYGYKTSVSKYMINHLKEKYNRFKKLSFFRNHSNILDIGSNDGTFLNFFVNNKSKHNLYGIDPSALNFKKNYKKKIKLEINFFSKEVVKRITEKNKNSKFSLITSFAMFYDIENPNSFCRDIENILEKNGIWALEFSYFPMLLSNLTYDQICHEHVVYYTLHTFNKILKKNKLRIIDFSMNEINGGSIEVICAKKNSKYRPQSKKIEYAIAKEKLISEKDYTKFNLRVENSKKNLILFLQNQKKTNVIGYGASTKGNVILNYCGITEKNISFICDENKSKHGKFTPGSHIKIISKNKMRKLIPKYLIVFIWSFRSEVIKQELDYIKKGGKLIFPLPIFHIVDKDNYLEYLKSDFTIFS
jgi:2-polyprenyl-3-methyl-5-hydroxy-6-metoxy-1,4-benzoquinol methylase